MKLNPQFVVNEQGKQTSVILPVEEYHQLLDVLEDRLDAVGLAEAAADEAEFTPYDQVRDQLWSERRT
jgi:hypothetical protein